MTITLQDKLKQLPKSQREKISNRAAELIAKLEESKNLPSTSTKKSKSTGK